MSEWGRELSADSARHFRMAAKKRPRSGPLVTFSILARQVSAFEPIRSRTGCGVAGGGWCVAGGTLFTNRLIHVV
jgi:hypothetical protein